VNATIGAPRQAPAGAEAVAPQRARRWSARLVPGDRMVWWAAGVVGLAGAVVLLVALLQPRELFLGSNSVAARADVVQIRPGVRMCVLRQRVPDGTGRIRFKIDSQTRAQPAYRVTVRPAGGPAISGRVAGSAAGFRSIDVPLERPLPDTARGFAFADICLTPSDTGGPVFAWGTNQLSDTDHPVRLGRHKDVPNRVALWFLPKTPQERSILGQLGTVFERASIFRPRFVGPWTFWLVLFGVFPFLCYAGVRLIARADEPRARRVPLPVWVALIGFGVAITWSFVTPAFPGYTSGHSTFSRAAAEVLTHFTGSPYVPDGLGEFHARAHEYLRSEDGPSVDVTLQWATWYDAADLAGQSRLWGGIHVSADDFMGRITGSEVGILAFDRAEQYFAGQVGP